MRNKQIMGDEDKMELYKDFIEIMLEFGYTPFFIGKELAFISRAIEQLGVEK